MDLDPQILRDKAVLLLQRERDLFELRMKHERVTLWLRFTQALPQIFADPRLGLDEAYRRVRKALLEALRLQRVLLFELDQATLRPLAPDGPERRLDDTALALVCRDRVGAINDPSDPAGLALAQGLGLGRFIWARMDFRMHRPVIIAAGYDPAKAKFQSPFDEGEAANLLNAAQHIHGLIENSRLAGELRAANETLEERVVERTRQLEQRNRDMRLVLDNVMTGLLTVDARGRLAAERSARIDDWFGAYEGNPAFTDYIAAVDEEFAASFALAHEALIEDFLPAELCLDQLPTQLRSRSTGRTYHVSYRPIAGLADDKGGLLIIISDVTDQLRLAQDEAEQGELLAMFQGFTRDRVGFVTFFEEASRLVGALIDPRADPATRRRDLHTLKGNAAMMGARVLAELCHRAEDELALDGAALEVALARVGERWSTIARTMESVVGGQRRDVVEIPSTELDQLCADIHQGASPAAVEQRLSWFKLEPVERPLGRLSRHASVLAARLGKPDLTVTIEADDARVNPRQFGHLWSVLVHVVRNAVDHGVESPAERLARGKPAGGRLTLRAHRAVNELALEIEDDGAGIDWAMVGQAARCRGLPHQTDADLLNVLLSDGFTTSAVVTPTSGRGQGMAVVHQEVRRLGGVLSVRSARGRGTCWRMVLPLDPAAPGSAIATGADPNTQLAESRERRSRERTSATGPR